MNKLLISCIAGLMAASALAGCRDDPAPTARQRQMSMALDNSSPFGLAMRNQFEILTGVIAHDLNHALAVRRCRPPGVSASEALFIAPHHQYLQAVGRQWLSDKPAYYVFRDGALLHALEQLSDDEYHQSLRHLRDPRWQDARTLADIVATLQRLFALQRPGAGDDPATHHKLAMLLAFRNALESAGHSDLLVRAISAIDPSSADAFGALPSTLSAPIEQKWITLTQWFAGDERLSQLSVALRQEFPPEVLDALDDHQTLPLQRRMAEASEAMRRWQIRAELQQPPATDQEQLGKAIDDWYFGDALSTELRLYMFYNYKVDLMRLADQYIDANYQELCPTLAAAQRRRQWQRPPPV